ncbi:MAG: hypothetical protein AAGI23_03050 [Bacteroidota bacterium]
MKQLYLLTISLLTVIAPMFSQNTDSNCDDFTAQIEFQDGSCTTEGSIMVEIENGVPPYKLRRRDLVIYGISTLYRQTSSFQWNEINPSSYAVTLTDGNGCTKQTMGDIENNDFLSKVEIIQQPSCEDQSDGKIRVELINGFSDSLTVELTGSSINRRVTVHSSIIEIDGLPMDQYDILIDNNIGCRRTVQEELKPFSFDPTPVAPTNCAQQIGTLDFGVSSSVNEQYTVEWSGPVEGQRDPSSYWGKSDLPFGNYTFQITSDRGCVIERVIEFKGHEDCGDIQAACDSFNIAIQNPRNEVCFEDKGMADVVIAGGTSNFTIEWEGASSGYVEIEGRRFTIRELAVGDYTVTVKDGNDCEKTAQFSIEETEGCTTEELGCDVLNVQVLGENVSCIDDGRLEVNVQGGKSPYVFIWSDQFFSGGDRQSAIFEKPFSTLDSLEKGDTL